MYEAHWQLQRAPFRNDADPAFFYAGSTHRAALLKLRYLVENRQGGALLLGGTGCGKTFLTAVLAKQLPSECGPVLPLLFPQLSPAELLGWFATRLGGDDNGTAPRGSLDGVIRQIELRLADWTRRGRHPVLIVDDAHLIEDRRVLQTLQLLLNFHQPGRAEFSLILAGQRELLGQVQRLPQLDDRLALKCLVQPFTRDETAEYIRARLKAAGAKRPVFSDDALQPIFELSGGVPRRINRVCDLALLIGYADRTDSITAAQIEGVATELTGTATVCL